MAYFEDQQLFKREVPHELTEQELKDQIEELNETVVKQKHVIDRLLTKVNSQTPSFSPTMIKPRDIPELTLTDLEGVEAGAKLALFIDRVEQVTTKEEARLQVAKTRLSNQIVFLVQSHQKQGHCQTWEQLKDFLRKEFANELSVDRAWQEVESISYDVEQDPHAFGHELQCKYALLELNFPKGEFPSRDQTIKRKICQGLPLHTRNKLEAYLEVTYPLKKFLERVDHERQFLLENPSCDLFHVKPKTTMSTNSNANLTPPQNSYPQHTSGPQLPPADAAQPVDPLKWEIQELAKKVDELMERRKRNLWCQRCRKGTHNTQDCWGAPRNTRRM